MKNKLLLGLFSSITVFSPMILAVSCGNDQTTIDSGDEITTEEEVEGVDINLTETFDVGIESAYAPYNFEVSNTFFNKVDTQSKSDIDIDPEDSLDPINADKFIEMIGKTNKNEYVAGVDVWLANQIGKELGDEVVFHKHKFSTIINGLNAGSYDSIISGMSLTNEREQQGIVFSDPYFLPKNVIVYQSGFSEYVEPKNWTDIVNDNRLIAVEDSSTQMDILEELIGQDTIHDRIVPKVNVAQAVDDMVSSFGSIGFVVCENTIAEKLIEKYASQGFILNTLEPQELNQAQDKIAVGISSKFNETPSNMTAINHVIENISDISEVFTDSISLEKASFEYQ